MNFFRKAVTVISGIIPMQRPHGDRSTGPRGWSYGSDSGEAVSERSVLALSSAWACINLIAGLTGALPLMVYRPQGLGRVVATEHPLYRLLHDSPNADQTSTDFWEFIAASLELRGNAYAEIDRAANGRVIALTPIWPDFMTVARPPGGGLEYRWFNGSGNDVSGPDRILHIRGFGGSVYGGLSTLSFGRNVFGLAQAVNQAAGAVFKNGARPTGALTVKNPLTGPQRKELEELLQEKFAGAMNAGRPMVLDNSAGWQQIAFSPDDAQMLESRNFSVEEVCRLFGTPPHMIGHTAGNTSLGSSIEQQTLGFVKFSLLRRFKRITKALEKQLLTPADRVAGIVIEFNIEGLLQGDSAARSIFYTAALTNGWMTINEVRALENMPPVPGGDVPRMQMQNVPITTPTLPQPVA